MTTKINLGKVDFDQEKQKTIIFPETCSNCGRPTQEKRLLYKRKDIGNIKYSARVSIPMCNQCQQARDFYDFGYWMLAILGGAAGFDILIIITSILGRVVNWNSTGMGCLGLFLAFLFVALGYGAAVAMGDSKLFIPHLPISYDSRFAAGLDYDVNHEGQTLSGWTLWFRDDKWAEGINKGDMTTVVGVDIPGKIGAKLIKIFTGTMPEPYTSSSEAIKNGAIGGLMSGGVTGLIILVLFTLLAQNWAVGVGMSIFVILFGVALGAAAGAWANNKVGANGRSGFKAGTLFAGMIPSLILTLLPFVVLSFMAG